MKPLGDAFIKLIKMLIAPIIFCTVVHGIASMEDMKKVGRVGFKALLYFEVMTTIALIIGLIIVNLWQPGAGMNVDPGDARHQGDRHLHRQGRRAEHRRVPPAHHPGHRGRCLRRGRDPAGAVLRHPVRLRAALAGREGQAAALHHRPDGARVLRHRRHRDEGGADRRLRRHGLHHRQVRRRHALVAGLADAGLLRHLPDLRLRRARPGRLAVRLLHPQVHPLHQGGAADRARHQLLGIGAAAHAGQDGEPGRRQVGGRPGHPDRLLVQPRRHLHLPDHGRGVPGPGDQHRPHLGPGAGPDRHPAADLQGCRRRHRLGLHRAGGDACPRSAPCRSPAWR